MQVAMWQVQNARTRTQSPNRRIRSTAAHMAGCGNSEQRGTKTARRRMLLFHQTGMRLRRLSCDGLRLGAQLSSCLILPSVPTALMGKGPPYPSILLFALELQDISARKGCRFGAAHLSGT